MNMKKIVLVLAVFISGLMIGCATTSVVSNLFDMQYESCNFALAGEFYLYTDVSTGVQYIVLDSSDGIGITPRYNADGSLVVK